MTRPYHIVDFDKLHSTAFDIENDLPGHSDMIDHEWRVRMTVYCDPTGSGPVEPVEPVEPVNTTLYDMDDSSMSSFEPQFRETPTHTKRTKVHFALMRLSNSILAWVQISTYHELGQTISKLSVDDGAMMLMYMNRRANVYATHIFNNRYEVRCETMDGFDGGPLPRCLYDPMRTIRCDTN
jgi:hypothetical protein